MNERIGFMQGRLSPLVNGKIQAFPWDHWREEFPIADSLGLRLMEWTLDQEGLYENPIMSHWGRSEILALCKTYGIKIHSLTGDCFMQQPFWKNNGHLRTQLESDFIAIVNSCWEVGISIIVIPLVDNGSLESIEQENDLVSFLKSCSNLLSSRGIRLAFESDYSPDKFAHFIGRLNPNIFGINYDIGNSASFGFIPKYEFGAYGRSIINVHVKDRAFGGTTMPLGAGSANFIEVFSGLSGLNYKGNFILQTARATDDAHSLTLGMYRDQTIEWLKNSYVS